MSDSERFAGWHVSRSWSGTRIEDECPCPQEPCGHVARDRIDPSCKQHRSTQTIRSAHSPDKCPGRRVTRAFGQGSRWDGTA